MTKRSLEQGRDTFIFYHDFGNFDLCVGLNSKVHRISIATFYRWLEILDDQGPKRPFELWKIDVKRYGLFMYSAERTVGPLPRLSQDTVEPGDYGTYIDRSNDGMLKGCAIGTIEPYINFEGKRRLYEKSAFASSVESLEHNDIEPFREFVEMRDKGVCFITGRATNKMEITWLVPPLWSDRAVPYAPGRLNFDKEIEEFKTVDNAWTIDAEILMPFMENKFGIDVEDNHKIVIFEPFEESEKLGTHLPHQSRARGRSDDFLKANFKHCLGVHLLGGDVVEDYPDRGQEFMTNISEKGWGRARHDKWDTPIGREILAHHAKRLPANFYDPDAPSSESDSDDGSE